MAQQAPQPRMHGITHNPGGSDPIPGLPPGQGAGGNWPALIMGVGGGPRGYWRLGEGATPYADTSGVGTAMPMVANPGDVGTPAMTQDVTPGLLPTATDDGSVAFVADGNDSTGVGLRSVLEGANNSKFDFGSRHAMSAIARIQPGVASHTFTGGVVGDISSNLATGGWALLVHFPDLAVSFMRCADPSTRVFCTAPAALVAGQAYSVVGTYDGTVSRIYVNGALAASLTDTGSFSYLGSYQDLTIGGVSGRTSTFGTWWPFVGVVDEVAVYNVALAAADIAALHAAATAVGAGWVLTSDGTGGMVWSPPSATVKAYHNGA